MPLQQAGDEKRDRDRRDDPRGTPRARLPLRKLVRRRLFRIDLLVCSKHALWNSNGAAFVENKAMDGRGGVAIADDCSRTVVSLRSDQGRSHRSMTAKIND
ncbi:MAG TPA: hypothetical protein VLI90_15210 [Tepidisphaeraceae bacterium]|nr:hypothetical protein [Tepidisphaeraceae bacterium]